eukprot:scaffold145548_cov130-Phaeocystis_antarctica.AAC.1
MAAGGLGRRHFAPTVGARRVALVRCYASRREAESGQAAFTWKRLSEQRRLWLCWEGEPMAQQRQVLHGVCETVGWRHRRLGMQTFKHLRLLVHRCAHRFASPLAAAA